MLAAQQDREQQKSVEHTMALADTETRYIFAPDIAALGATVGSPGAPARGVSYLIVGAPVENDWLTIDLPHNMHHQHTQCQIIRGNSLRTML